MAEKEPGPGSPGDDKKPTTVAELLPQEDEVVDDAELFAKLVGADGKLKVDTSLPAEYELEVQAAMSLEHLSAYQQTRQQWRSARNQADHQRAQKLFQEMNFHQLTAAIIQAEYPAVKNLTSELARTKVAQMKQQREALLKQKKDGGG